MTLSVKCSNETVAGSILTDRNEADTCHVNIVCHHSISRIVNTVYDSRVSSHVQFGLNLVDAINHGGHDGQCTYFSYLCQSFFCTIRTFCVSYYHIFNHSGKRINVNFGYINQRVGGIFHSKRCREELNVCTLTNNNFVEDIRELLYESVLCLCARNGCRFHYKSFQLASQRLAEVRILHVKVRSVSHIICEDGIGASHLTGNNLVHSGFCTFVFCFT